MSFHLLVENTKREIDEELVINETPSESDVRLPRSVFQQNRNWALVAIENADITARESLLLYNSSSRLSPPQGITVGIVHKAPPLASHIPPNLVPGQWDVVSHHRIPPPRTRQLALAPTSARTALREILKQPRCPPGIRLKKVKRGFINKMNFYKATAPTIAITIPKPPQDPPPGAGDSIPRLNTNRSFLKRKRLKR